MNECSFQLDRNTRLLFGTMCSVSGATLVYGYASVHLSVCL